MSYFTGQIPVMSPSQQSQSTEHSSMQWPKPGKITHWTHHHFLIRC